METKENKKFYRAADVMEELSCSSAYAYKVIRILNAELQKKGFLTASGRVPAAYFFDRYGVEKKP